MTVIKKKDEKAKHIFSLMRDTDIEEEFKTLLCPPIQKTMHSSLKHIIRRNAKTKGKEHPMPTPDKYLYNMYNVEIKKMKEAED